MDQNNNDMYNSGDPTTEYPENYSSVEGESSADKIVKRIKKSSVNMISFRTAVIAFIFAVAFIAMILSVLVHNGWLANDTVGNAQIKNSETYELEGLDVAGNTVLGTTPGDTLIVNGIIGSSLIPAANSSFDLGSSDNYWDELYVQTIRGWGVSQIKEGFGISISPSTGVSIVTVSVRGGNGICVSANGVSVRGGNGICVSANGVSVRGGNGICVSANGVSVRGGNGICVSASGVSVRGGNGICVSANGVSVRGGNGICVSANGVSVRGGNGICVSANGVSVRGGNGICVSANGVSVRGGNGICVSANGVSVRGGNGICVSASGVSVRGGNGICVSANGVSVRGGNGICVSANGVSVRGGNGICVSANGVSVRGGNGICVSANGVSVSLHTYGGLCFQSNGLRLAGTNNISNKWTSINLGGTNNSIGNTSGDTTNSIIVGGEDNSINSSDNVILAGTQNSINAGSRYGVIVGGVQHILGTEVRQAIIGGIGCSIIGLNSSIIGSANCNIASINSIIGGGTNCNIASSSNFSGIISGENSTISGVGGAQSDYSVIIGGTSNSITTSEKSVILGGDGCSITGINSSIIGSENCNIASFNSIIGGGKGCSIAPNSNYSGIISGQHSTISGVGVVGAQSINSVIIGGTSNSIINSPNSVILGGEGLSINGVFIHDHCALMGLYNSDGTSELANPVTGDKLRLVVGTGGGDTTRKNAFSVDNEGNLFFGATTGGASIYRYDGDGTGTYTVKAFTIQHPEHEDRWLRHGCLEGPEAGVYYRGKDIAPVEVSIPSYATKIANDFSIQLTPIGKPRMISCDEMDEDGKFQVYGEGPFFWHVTGKRLGINIEPYKSEVNIKSIGPYSWEEN